MSSLAELRRKKKPENPLREIQVLIISANGLKNVKHVTKVRAYAVVYVEKDVDVAKTHVDEEGGVNPTWNEVVKVKFHRSLMEEEDNVMAAVNVDIYAHGHLREKPIGSARVLLCDVLKGGDEATEPSDNHPVECLTVQIRRATSGRPHGLLNMWVPPTGKFSVRRESLSFSYKDENGEEKVAGPVDLVVAADEEKVEEMEEEKDNKEVKAAEVL